jgi:hypothetical protein
MKTNLTKAQIAMLKLLTNQGSYISYDPISLRYSIWDGTNWRTVWSSTYTRLAGEGLLNHKGSSWSNEFVISLKGREVLQQLSPQ